MLEPLAAAARTMSVQDVSAVVFVSESQISPDGKQIVIVVTRSDYENNKDTTDLVLVDVTNGAKKTLTHNIEGISYPRWSPSGERIAFLAQGGGDQSATQIFVVPKNAGPAQKITNAPNGVDVLEWRPDGNAIAFSTADDPPNKKAIAKGHDEFMVGDDPFLITAAPTPEHVWLVPSEGGAARRITEGVWSLPRLDIATPLSWSPDGKFIAITKWPNAHNGDSNSQTIAVIDAASGHLRKLTQRTKFEGFAQYSPDGTKIAYWYPKNGDSLNGTKIFVTSASGGNGSDVTAALDRDISHHEWMPDGKSLIIGATSGTRVALWQQPLDGPARRLDLGNVNPSWDNSVDINVGKDGAIAIAGAESQRPTELYYMSSPTTPVRRLTDFNHRIAALDLGRTVRITWRFEGFLEDGTLTYPPNFRRGIKYPLVVELHGGPNYTSTEEFWHVVQIIAARGYLVFRPNYRGSDNLGDAYEHAIFNDGGAGPGRDIMAGVKAVKDLGIVDSSKIAVQGLSYGGYMTAWLVSHYPGWKAAVEYSAEFDPLEQYNLEDFNVAEWIYFKTSPWTSAETMQAYRAQSPLTYASRIKTPTLLVANSGDVRVPIAGAFAMYHALKDNHVPVTFIAFPESGHTVGGPVHARDLWTIWLAWLDRYLK